MQNYSFDNCCDTLRMRARARAHAHVDYHTSVLERNPSFLSPVEVKEKCVGVRCRTTTSRQRVELMAMTLI